MERTIAIPMSPQPPSPDAAKDSNDAPLPPAHRTRKRAYAGAPAPRVGTSMKSEINVTPLVDVVLVLLIIFMVVTPMLSRGIRIALPATSHHEERRDTGEQVVVSITGDGSIFVDTEAVADDAIEDTIRRALATRRRDGAIREVHVKGDRGLTYGQVRALLDRIHKGGASGVALGTEALRPSEER